VTGADGEFVLAVVDDYSPSAADQNGNSLTIYFRDAGARDAAKQALAAAFPDAVIAAREVDDEDWARRSQKDLLPITVAGITVYPSLRELRLLRPSPEPQTPSSVAIVIQPSMGFGTGHHATTRLCLLALQREDLAGRTVLDVGTGSGILAIAAARLGASRAVGIDNDSDAVHAARENLALNPEATGVTFEVAELEAARLNANATGGATDIVVANLTGALLAREGHRIRGAVRPGGRIIVSGLLAEERDQVVAAFTPAVLVAEARADEWVALTFAVPHPTIGADFLSNR
jgi:ribosomal protein L11 methyltransferase